MVDEIPRSRQARLAAETRSFASCTTTAIAPSSSCHAEPLSQGGSVGSNPIGATNQNPLRRKGFCAYRGEDSATPIRARDTPGTHQGGQVPFLCLHG